MLFSHTNCWRPDFRKLGLGRYGVDTLVNRLLPGVYGELLADEDRKLDLDAPGLLYNGLYFGVETGLALILGD